MRLRRAFDLGDFYDWLVAHALHCIVVIERIARPVFEFKHLTVRAV